MWAVLKGLSAAWKAAVAVSVCVIVFLFLSWRPFDFLPDLWGSGGEARATSVVLEKITETAKFEAATAQVQALVIVGEGEDEGLIPKLIPGALDENFAVLQVGAELRATFDLGSLTDESLRTSADGTALTVTLPPAVIEDPVISSDDLEIVYEGKGLLSMLDGGSFDEARDVLAEAEKEVRDSEIVAELEESAEASITTWFESLGEALGYEVVRVEIDEDLGPQDS